MAVNTDLRALRNYVLADTGAQNQAESTVRLMVTHSNLKANFMEIRLDMHVSADKGAGTVPLPLRRPCPAAPPRRCPEPPRLPSLPAACR